LSDPEKREPSPSTPRRVPARKPLTRRPLHLTILRFSIVLVLLTTAGIGFPTYWNTRSAVSDLSNKLVQEIAQQTVAKAKTFLDQARPTLALSRQRLMNNPRFGTRHGRSPQQEEWKARARLFVSLMQADPTRFDRVYFGDSSGDFTSAYQNKENGVQVDHRWITRDSSRQETFHREVFQVGPSDQWVPVEAQAAPFDPRKRPWYQAAEEKRRQIWTPPYLFTASKQPGITAALPIIDARNRVIGVCGIDFQLRDLDNFVSQLTPLETGKVFIFAGEAGREGVVAQPGRAQTGESADSASADLHLLPASQSPDPVVKSAAEWLAGRRDQPQQATKLSDMEFTAGAARYLGATYPFDVGEDLHWTTIVAIPEEKVLGVVRQNNGITLFCCIAAVLGAGLFGTLFSLQVSRPLRTFATEMSRVRNLEFSEEPSPPSSIDEVHEMGAALDTMKIGLRSFEKYVPTDLVRMLLQSGRDPVLGGESAPLTVMFADIVGFTSISEQMSPRELVNALADYLEEMEKIVWEHKGIVDKYIGDAIMALWNTPILPQGEAARHACIAALECIHRLKALQAEREFQSRPFFVLNVGIHTGEALVGNIGSQRRYNYTAMGDTVNLTSRLESLNRIYGTKILLSESTYEVVHADFEVRLIDHVAVKGRKAPLNIYELLARQGELDAALRPLLKAYAEGLERYRARDWRAALEKFKEAMQAAPQPDPPSALFMARCEEYLLSPPPEDWEGVYVYTKK
jgi:adenylate cyclase